MRKGEFNYFDTELITSFCCQIGGALLLAIFFVSDVIRAIF